MRTDGRLESVCGKQDIRALACLAAAHAGYDESQRVRAYVIKIERFLDFLGVHSGPYFDRRGLPSLE